MASLDDIRYRTEETAEHIAAKSVEIARSAADKAKLVARMSKLNADVITEKDALRRAYFELGKLYYKKYREAPDSDFAEQCSRIASSIAVIKESREEIRQCKEAFKGTKEEEPPLNFDAEVVTEEEKKD